MRKNKSFYSRICLCYEGRIDRILSYNDLHGKVVIVCCAISHTFSCYISIYYSIHDCIQYSMHDACLSSYGSINKSFASVGLLLIVNIPFLKHFSVLNVRRLNLKNYPY